MRDISHRAGAKLVVVIIPGEVQVDGALQDEVIRAHGRSSDQFDFELPNRLLAGELAQENIPTFDLLPLFKQEAGRARLYKPRDTHWNITGNRLAAAAIATFLRQHIAAAADEARR